MRCAPVIQREHPYQMGAYMHRSDEHLARTVGGQVTCRPGEIVEHHLTCLQASKQCRCQEVIQAEPPDLSQPLPLFLWREANDRHRTQVARLLLKGG
jgi:hypothetical protein